MSEDILKAIDGYREDVNKFLDTNSLTVLNTYEKLQNKDIIGSSYRDDQNFLEKVSEFKAKYFSVKAFLIKESSKTTDRVGVRSMAAIMDVVNEDIKRLDTILTSARQRVKFYESVIYLVSNMSYGDF